MKNSQTSAWKSAFFGSALALASQAALANKPLPCPTTSPLVDTIGLVQGDTKQKVENRLRAIDSQKHHQVVVVTVNNLGEYGYGSIEEMANAIGMNCKVGYRGEDTGVVVLYTKVPSLYRIETAATERYITDAHSKQFIGHSKSDGVCRKEDVACRLDDITSSIDTIIRKQFPDKQSVEIVLQSIKKFDEKKAEKETSDLLSTLGIGAIVLVVIGGAVAGGNSLVKRNRRKALKKQVFELSTKFKVEMAKYPEWFLENRSQDPLRAIGRLEECSDEKLDDIATGGRWKVAFGRDITIVEDTIRRFPLEYTEIIEDVESKTKEVNNEITRIRELETSLKKDGYILPAMNIPVVTEGSHPDETIKLLNKYADMIHRIDESLSSIPEFYTSVKGLNTLVQKEFDSKKAELEKVSLEHNNIYGGVKLVDVPKIEKELTQLIADFQGAYQVKNMPVLKALQEQSKTIFKPISAAVSAMKQDIEWYNKIPAEIASRQKQLQGIKIKPEYEQEAKKFISKTGKRTFADYNMSAAILLLQQLLNSLTKNHSDKKNFSEVEKEMRAFDSEYRKLQEYTGLGAALAAIIAEEIEEERRAEKRRLEEIARKKREQKEEEERRERAAAAALIAASSRNDDDNRGGGGGWSPGGGGGFSGGGATDD